MADIKPYTTEELRQVFEIYDALLCTLGECSYRLAAAMCHAHGVCEERSEASIMVIIEKVLNDYRYAHKHGLEHEPRLYHSMARAKREIDKITREAEEILDEKYKVLKERHDEQR